MALHICTICGKEYKSRKPNTKFCSKDCMQKAKPRHNVNCDYCGKEFEIEHSRYNAYVSGKHKHIYCSKQCANEGFKSRITKKCEWCGEEFTLCKSVGDVQRFCSRKCYLEYGNRDNICQHCGKSFHPNNKHREQKYCSQKCKHDDMYEQIFIECDNCGDIIKVAPFQLRGSSRHFCNKKCKNEFMNWSECDNNILTQNYGIISTKEISNLLSKKYSVKAIRSHARSLGIKTRSHWTEEEKQIVVNNYSNMDIFELSKLLPNRTIQSIKDFAANNHIYSKYYKEHFWNEDEDNYLKDNYGVIKTRQIAENMNRSYKSVAQRANTLRLKWTPIIGESFKKLSEFVRSQNSNFHLIKLKEKDYVCELTGKQGNVVLHHIYSFNLILNEAVEMSGIEPKDNFYEYTSDELYFITKCFRELQDKYNATICISEYIHKQFHSEYGYGNNTIEQWDEFVKKYYNN